MLVEELVDIARPVTQQSIIPGLKTNLDLSPSYSAHKSSNHIKFSELYKISLNTTLQSLYNLVAKPFR